MGRTFNQEEDMMKRLILAAVAAAAFTVPAMAQQTYKFAIVPKAMNNPYFDLSRDGCIKRAKELGNIDFVPSNFC